MLYRSAPTPPEWRLRAQHKSEDLAYVRCERFFGPVLPLVATLPRNSYLAPSSQAISLMKLSNLSEMCLSSSSLPDWACLRKV